MALDKNSVLKILVTLSVILGGGSYAIAQDNSSAVLETFPQKTNVTGEAQSSTEVKTTESETTNKPFPLSPQIKPATRALLEQNVQPMRALNQGVKQEVRTIQMEKREDANMMKQETKVKNDATKLEAKTQITDNRAQMKTDMMVARKDGLTEEERTMLKEKASLMRLDNTNLRVDAQAKIKLERETGFQNIAERRDQAHGAIKKVLEERRSKIDGTRAGVLEERKQMSAERAGAHLEKLISRMSAAIERFEKLSARIQSRLEKVKSSGGNVTVAETELANSTVAIVEAKAGLANISATFGATITSEDPKTQVESLRKAVRDVGDKIKLAGESLKKAVESMKGQKGITATATVVLTSETPSEPPTNESSGTQREIIE